MSTQNSFFTLLNVVTPENRKKTNKYQNSLNTDDRENRLDIRKDNEWMQEYHIIYNSYVLDDKESTRTYD